MRIILTWAWLQAALGAGQVVGTTSGAIGGTVTDSTGDVLPGVAVVVTGDAMMRTRSTSSGGDGRYAVGALPPGEYVVAFTRAGFATEKREGVLVSLGFTATVNVALRPASQEEVLVTSGTPVVDARSTALGATFDAATLGNLPGSRNMGSILAATPAIYLARFDVGGTGTPVALYGAYGATGVGLPQPKIEGIDISGIAGMLGLSLDYGPLDEVSVGAGAHGVEWASPGVQMQISTRSGGNRYRASFYADVEPRQWQSHNIDADQIARGATGTDLVPAREANRAWRYHDLNAGVGGFIRPDRLWWHGSVRHQEVAIRRVNFPVRPIETRLSNYGGKVTGAIGQHRLIAFGQASTNDQPTRLDPFGQGLVTAANAVHQSDASTTNSHAWGGVWKGEWNAVMRDTMFVEMRAGQFGGNRHEQPNGSGPRKEDVSTLVVEGGGRDWQTSLRRNQVHGSVTYAPAGGAGRHMLKGGGEVVRSLGSDTWWRGYPGDVLHVFRNARPAEAYLLQTPSQSRNGLWSFGAYLSDTYRVQRFTLTLGLRFDRDRVDRPAQQHPAGRFNAEAQAFPAEDNVIDWNLVTPRLGVVFDVFGDARTLVKVSAGWYRIAPGLAVGANANPNATTWFRRYTWSDPNGSGEWEEGEEGVLLGARGGADVESLDPALSLPYLREFTAFIERELDRGVAVRTGVVWRGERREYQRENQSQPAADFSVPILVADPGPDGIPGTADDGSPVQAFQLRPETLGLPPVNVVRNASHGASDYWTWEVGATARGHRRWTMNAGFVLTWNREQSNVQTGQTIRQHRYAHIPNDFINTDEDGRHTFRRWSAKIAGTYTGPWDVRVTPFLLHQSGQPFGRTFGAVLNYSRTVSILAEPIGTRRMDHITLLDVRVEKGFRLGDAGRLAGFLDVFNILNANPEQNVNWSSDAFLKPLSIVSPRIARIGVKFDW